MVIEQNGNVRVVLIVSPLGELIEASSEAEIVRIEDGAEVSRTFSGVETMLDPSMLASVLPDVARLAAERESLRAYAIEADDRVAFLEAQAAAEVENEEVR